MPSLVAVIVAVPGATAVTIPVAGTTIATAEALELQATVRPVRMLPLASRAVAVAVVVPPTLKLVAPNATETLATGTTLTVIVALPVLPSLVAVIVAVPAATPPTTPVAASTEATEGALELQMIVRPVSVLPLASRVTAVACVVVPTVIVDAASDTATLATGGGELGGGCDAGGATIATVADPLRPSETPVIVADPAEMPVTTPDEGSTLATRAFDDCQATVRPVSTLPLASSAIAVA
ncbi:MAG TPA: hypothetical protein VN650_13210 [Gemmatimonadaceae bacterium]|nr:hypothetical protein [Gemmatimonadaceae bacterium]